jgi:uncharacterized protein (TIGR02284 family)
MDRTEILKRLNDLIQLDVDAVEAYTQAIRHVKYDDIKKRLTEYQEDHKDHVQDLTAMVRSLDGKPVDSTPDLKGYLIEGFTALRSVTGPKGALEAMRSNERLTNRRYEEAAALDFPEEVLALVKKNLTDERVHLHYIEEIITTPRREL